MDEPITWTAAEYEPRNKSVDWFWGVGIVAVSFAIVAIIFENILFAIFILLAAFSLLLFTARTPHEVEFSLTKRGIRIDRTLYPYATLRSFWIHNHNNERKKLIVQSEKALMPYVTIPIPLNVDEEHIQDFLEQYLPEEEHPESMSEIVMEYLGF